MDIEDSGLAAVEARSKSFSMLKPVCVRLSQLTLQRKIKKADTRPLNEVLGDLLATLDSVPILNAKLADYVFFPLSYVFQDATLLSWSQLSLAIQCLERLIQYGWSSTADTELVIELLVLLSLQLRRASSNGENLDALLSIMSCLITIFRSMRESICELCASKRDTMAPMIDQTLHMLLVALKESPYNDVQLAAAVGIRGLLSSLADKQLLRACLPGIVSHFSIVLKQSTRVRRIYRVLVEVMLSLSLLFQKALSKESVGVIHESEATRDGHPDKRDSSWEQATASQVLLALVNIVGLQHHDRFEVLEALADLCFIILDDCKDALRNCQSIMLGTLCTVLAQGFSGSRDVRAKFTSLVTADESLNIELQTLCEKWLSSLPRKLQANNEVVYTRHVELICFALDMLHTSHALQAKLWQPLFDVIEDSANTKLTEITVQQVVTLENSTLRDVTTLLREPGSTQISKKPALSPLVNPVLLSLSKLLFAAKQRLPAELSSYIDSRSTQATPNRLLGALWMLSKTLDQSVMDGSTLDELLEIETDDVTRPHLNVEMALSRALEVLSTPIESQDWRLEAIALEILSSVARVEKQGFCLSLTDALFPIVERLGSNEPLVRRCAINCLDTTSQACGYANAGDMIIQNVDYLVNAVAFKLNNFDASPQTTKVLTMMLDLSGPTLIPYMDDLVEALFGALGAYHGYPRLVENLFSVLASVVKQSTKSDSPLLEMAHIKHQKVPPSWVSVEHVRIILESTRTPRTDRIHQRAEITGCEESSTARAAEPNDHSDQLESSKALSQKVTKTYYMIQSVLRLSQHYLTHQDPYIRQRLLDIIAIGCTGLAGNEDEFLPLVNDIWPVVIGRLFDEEAVVVFATVEALASLFKGAGDFLSSRVEREWPEIQALFQRTQAKTIAEQQGKLARGPFNYSSRILEALTTMLVQLMQHVRVTPEIEDDLFELFSTVAEKRRDVRDALHTLNADAVWLLLDAPTSQAKPPKASGFTFRDVDLS